MRSRLVLDLCLAITVMTVFMGSVAIADRVVHGAWPWGWPS